MLDSTDDVDVIRPDSDMNGADEVNDAVGVDVTDKYTRFSGSTVDHQWIIEMFTKNILTVDHKCFLTSFLYKSSFPQNSSHL